MGTGKGGSPAKICVERGSNKSSEAQEGEVTVENLHQPSMPRDVQETKQINPGGHTIYWLGNTSCHQWNSSTKQKNELLQTGQFCV